MQNNKLRALAAFIAASMLVTSVPRVFAEDIDDLAETEKTQEEVIVESDANTETGDDTESEPEADVDEADEANESVELETSAITENLSDLERIDFALGRLGLLNFSEKKAKVTTVSPHLPTSIRTEDDGTVSVRWTSSDESWMTNDGGIMQYPEKGSHKVTLTAVLTSGNESVTKEFEVAIKADEEVKAFPGAQGYGTQTRGGAYGYVYHVTTLAAEGPGSLKEAIEERDGARTIVFDVGGTIDLTPLGRALNLKSDKGSNVTIAGQTAPGEGIQLKGYGLSLSNVHDVIIRNISIRIGNVRKAGDTYQSDPLSVSGANQRVVLDHLSMCWAVDMGFRVYGEEITMSNCMVSKGLYWNTPHEKGKHNYAGMFGPKYGTFYNNYIADCGQRAPRIIDNEFIDVRNNVIANTKYSFDICNYEWMGANPKFNIVNNAVLMGSPQPGGSTSNVTSAGSYKYFQGREYSGGLFTYSVNNYDNTQGARAISANSTNIDGALWTGTLTPGSSAETRVGEEMGAFSSSGYSNIGSAWQDMIFPGDISLSDYNSSLVSKQGNTLMPYPFAAPYVKTYSPRDAAKNVLENAGSRGRFDGDILTRRYLAEGRTRLQISTDYLKGAEVYGVELPEGYSADTAYGLPVHTQTEYIDQNGMTVWDIDGKTVPAGDAGNYEADPEVIRYITTADDPEIKSHSGSMYATDTDGNKYLLKIYDYTDTDDIHDAFDLFDIDGSVLSKPNNYGTTVNGSDGMHWKRGIVLNWADWGDGPGNYDHSSSSATDGNIGTDIADTEWSVYDWPQLTTVYRDGKWDTNRDGIPDFYVELMGWPSGDADISREDFEGRGYTNLEYYINDCCAGDMESEEGDEDTPAPAENVRNGSSKFDTHKSHEILFNTVKRAKAKIYYCEGDSFNEAEAKEIALNRYYDYDVDDVKYKLDSDNKPVQSRYRTASDFDTYFSYVFEGLKPDTTYSYKIKTYTDTGVESMTEQTYSFKTKPASAGKPGTPRITKYVPFDGRITINYEPASENKSYNQRSYVQKNASDSSKKTYNLTYIGNNSYDKSTDHYILRYSTSADMSGAKSVELPNTSTSYVLTGLTNGTKYYLDLRAVSADGTESDCAVYNQKQIADTGRLDKDGNKVYSVQGVSVNNKKVVEYYPDYDVNISSMAIEPTRYTINVDYAKMLEENEIGEGETTKFTTVFGDVYDWYIYTLGGIPIPTTPEGGDKPILMLRDDNHDHGFTYAKKFDTPLDGKATIHCKLMIKNEVLDPMNQAPELRFYLQQDSADSDNAEQGDEEGGSTDTGSADDATVFGTIASLTFTKNNLNFNGSAISRYTTDTWYDIKILLNGDDGTCDLYVNDKLIRAGLEYSDSATSNTIARWQISSRLAGTEDVYIEYMYAYTGWDEPVTDPDATPKPDNTVQEGTSGPRGGGGGGGGGGGVVPTTTATPAPTGEPSETPSDEPSGDPTAPTVPKFTDMKGYDWAEEAVTALAGRGIVNGISDTEFAPGRNITRAEFAAILMRGFGLENADAKCSFTDVPENAWYYSAVASAYELGVITGYSDTEFGANDNISRQDMAVMVNRLLDKVDITLDEVVDYSGFDDAASIADYAKSAVELLYSGGIIDGVGDNKFDPTGKTTRAAAAKVLYGILKPAWEIEMEE
ncbi:MAG: S-layer homology domain-containing protein [Oscillospiraceae bacterium]|nr:S-layer homology domain-containing protein [Oscillospiraceae bacterium]